MFSVSLKILVKRVGVISMDSKPLFKWPCFFFSLLLIDCRLKLNFLKVISHVDEYTIISLKLSVSLKL